MARGHQKENSETILVLLEEFYKNYSDKTKNQTKLIDLFLVFQLAVGLLQLFYVIIVGTFPYNSFLSGFISCAGLFVLTGSPSFF